MKKLIAALLVSTASLSGCAVMDMAKASYERENNKALDLIYPTHAERSAILKRAATESVSDPHFAHYNWLYINTDDKGKKYYVNTTVVSSKNTAAGAVKTLNPDQSYKIINYRFFCYEGYGRKLSGHSYTADHKKKFQLIGFGPGEEYDRRPMAEESHYAKAICALGGFSRDAA
ncbi:hypothetical protein [Psychrobacter aestuarii]|uniref:Uncharacterized protein n=1 Tax=Psychrobacter aestuarii TaxID=556327 RepID=A0ABP3FGP5_9GAMM|nr:hypothetical protein [Psychrobacter aestuarii]